MYNNSKKYFFLICLLVALTNIYSQVNKADSLWEIYDSVSVNDTVKLNALDNLAWGFIYSNPDSAFKIATIELEGADRINIPSSKAKALSIIGTYYSLIGNDKKAHEKFLKALDIYISINSKEGIAKVYTNLGNTYKTSANYSKALEYYLLSLKINEEIRNIKGQAQNYGNIAVLYREKGEYSKAILYFNESLAIFEKTKDKQNIVKGYAGLGVSYLDQEEYAKAETYLFKSLKLSRELNNKSAQASNLTNLGSMYFKLNKLDTANRCFLLSEKLNNEMGDLDGQATSLMNLAVCNILKGKYTNAEKFLKKALVLSKQTGNLDRCRIACINLSLLYDSIKNPTLSLKYFKDFVIYKDSIANENDIKKLTRLEMQYEFDRKEMLVKAEQEKKDMINLKEKAHNKLIIGSVSVFLILVIVFTFYIYRNLQISKRQKVVIEEKHKEITDSINYAERIQRSFLATRELLDENLKDYFILFQPKDVVSGDFYWASKLKNGSFALVTADSTGHGVPGAIMSILNISSLEKAVEFGLSEPADIFQHTRRTIIERLKKDGSMEGGKDGMDASLICFDFANNKMSYVAANNPILVVRKHFVEFDARHELIELKPDKMPVGKHEKDGIPFTQHYFELKKGDIVYTLTDGFADQFGGVNGKKFMYKKLKESLISISNLTMNEQKEALLNELNKWKGTFEQVDDICLIGIRI